MWFTQLALLAAGFAPVLVSGDVLSLSGLHWSLKNENGSIIIPAKVPSQAHLDLLDAGIITEPLLGINGASHNCRSCVRSDLEQYRLHAKMDRE